MKSPGLSSVQRANEVETLKSWGCQVGTAVPKASPKKSPKASPKTAAKKVKKKVKAKAKAHRSSVRMYIHASVDYDPFVVVKV